MKKFVLLLFISVFTSAANSIPLLFEEGKHYQVINDKASTAPNVTEFFSFYCPHCFRFESLAKDIENTLPENVTFKKSHVEFMRSAPADIQQALTRALVLANKLDNKDKIIADIFAQIHTKRKGFKNKNEVKEIFLSNGVDEEFYDEKMKSRNVKGIAYRMKNRQENLSMRKILTGVPMFIINNKYKILSKELHSKEDYIKLVNFLLNLDS